MLKWLGVSLAAAASIALGFGISAAMGQRVHALGSLIRGLTLLARRIALLAEPMPQALSALQHECPVFAAALANMDELPSLAWDIALSAQRGLTPQDAVIVKRAIADSGAAPLGEQERIFAACIDLLKSREAQAAEKARGDAKLAKTLGLIAAAVMLILAI